MKSAGSPSSCSGETLIDRTSSRMTRAKSCPSTVSQSGQVSVGRARGSGVTCSTLRSPARLIGGEEQQREPDPSRALGRILASAAVLLEQLHEVLPDRLGFVGQQPHLAVGGLGRG